jgi:hypothetical protein
MSAAVLGGKGLSALCTVAAIALAYFCCRLCDTQHLGENLRSQLKLLAAIMHEAARF